MSLYRDSSYSAAAAVFCRANGHAWCDDRCSTCRLRRDDFARPHSRNTPGVSAPLTALPVGRMEPVMGNIVQRK